MKKYNFNTPEGTRDLLFEECAVRRKIEKRLMDLFVQNGCSEVITPFVEFNDVFESPQRYFSAENLYKLSDSKGRLITLRPDCTLPIIRLAETRLKDVPRPLKLCYNQTIYRSNPKEAGRDDEIVQSGIEIIGGDGCDEAADIAFNAVKAVAMEVEREFKFEIGDCGIFTKLIAKYNIDDEKAERIRKLIEIKNINALAGLDCPPVFAELPKLYGGEEVFGKFAAMESDETLVAELKRIYAKFGGKAAVDLGLVNKRGYYNGILYNGYIDGFGKPVLSGGSYKIGEVKGNGFAVNITAVTQPPKPRRKTVRIALTKGRLEKESIKLFSEMGWDVSQFADKGRKLMFSLPEQNVEIVLAKAPDVITYVETGVCDMGITGRDMIDEYRGKYAEMLDLGVGKCRFAFIAEKLKVGENVKEFYSGHSIKTIASKYTNVTRRFFEAKGMDVDIYKIEGSVELAPILDLADGIVDIVETGATLKENGLEIIEEISGISARVIVNPVNMKMKKEHIDVILEAMNRVIRERNV